jgi:hypothetical protein
MEAAEEPVPSDGIRLTSRLVSEESMKRGIVELLLHARHYVWGIKRPSFDMSSGRDQSTDLILSEEDNLTMDGQIDPRLLKARRINLVITVKDGGTATINFKTRYIHIAADSPGLRKALASFNRCLRLGARSRWISMISVLSLILAPLFLIFSLFIIESSLNPKSSSVHPVYDRWFNPILASLFVLWAISVSAALLIYIVIWRSGPLRIWPRGLTFKSILRAIYRIRVSDAVRRNATTIGAAIIASVISGTLVYLLTRL